MPIPIRATKRYADGHQKNQGWRKHFGFKIGKNKIKPQPSSHAKRRAKERTK